MQQITVIANNNNILKINFNIILEEQLKITTWIKKNELLSHANAKCYTVQKTKRNAYKSVAPVTRLS